MSTTTETRRDAKEQKTDCLICDAAQPAGHVEVKRWSDVAFRRVAIGRVCSSHTLTEVLNCERPEGVLSLDIYRIPLTPDE